MLFGAWLGGCVVLCFRGFVGAGRRLWAVAGRHSLVLATVAIAPKKDREKAAEKQKHLNQRVETELEISFSNSPKKDNDFEMGF